MRRRKSVVSLIPRVGGKSALAFDLADIINETQYTYDLTTYIEPMGGGARTLLNIDPFPFEYYCEIEKGIANVFKCVANSELVDQFVERLRKIEVCKETFDQYLYNREHIKDIDDDVLCSGIMNYFLAHWSWCGRMKKFKVVKDQCAFAKQVDNYFNKLDNIYDIHERLKNVTIESKDGLKLIEEFKDDKDTLIYVDPPYITRERKKGKSYEFDWFPEDHKNLTELLFKCKGKVILSGYETEEYNWLLENGWKKCFLERLTTSSQVLTEQERKDGKSKKTEDEYIWVNFDLPMSDINRYGIE